MKASRDSATIRAEKNYGQRKLHASLPTTKHLPSAAATNGQTTLFCWGSVAAEMAWRNHRLKLTSACSLLLHYVYVYGQEHSAWSGALCKTETEGVTNGQNLHNTHFSTQALLVDLGEATAKKKTSLKGALQLLQTTLGHPAESESRWILKPPQQGLQGLQGSGQARAIQTACLCGIHETHFLNIDQSLYSRNSRIRFPYYMFIDYVH